MPVTITKTGPFAFDGIHVRGLIEGETLDDLPVEHEAQLLDADWATTGEPKRAATKAEPAKEEKSADPVKENKALHPAKENKGGK